MKSFTFIFLVLLAVPPFAGLRAEEMNLAALQEKTTIQCGSLIYGGAQTSVCFADHFLTRVTEETTLQTAHVFTPVQLGSDALFNTPFSVWSGEGDLR